MVNQLSEELEESSLIHPKKEASTVAKSVITEETPVEALLSLEAKVHFIRFWQGVI